MSLNLKKNITDYLCCSKCQTEYESGMTDSESLQEYSKLDLKYIDKNFETIERIFGPEFERDWGFEVNSFNGHSPSRFPFQFEKFPKSLDEKSQQNRFLTEVLDIILTSGFYEK